MFIKLGNYRHYQQANEESAVQVKTNQIRSKEAKTEKNGLRRLIVLLVLYHICLCCLTGVRTKKIHNGISLVGLRGAQKVCWEAGGKIRKRQEKGRKPWKSYETLDFGYVS